MDTVAVTGINSGRKFCLLDLQFGRNYPVFQRNLLPPSGYNTLMDAASSCEMMV